MSAGPQGGPTHPTKEDPGRGHDAPARRSLTSPLLAGFFLFLWFCSQRCRSEAEAEAEKEAFSSSQMMH